MLRRAVNRRAVRVGLPRGDGLRAARDRHTQRRSPSFVNVTPGEPDGWLVPPDDKTALAEAMVAAVENEAERTWRGINAHRHARENYSWQHVAGQVIDVYERHALPTGHHAR